MKWKRKKNQTNYSTSFDQLSTIIDNLDQNENDSYIFDRHFLPKSTLEYHLRDAEQLLDISILKQKIRKTERTMDQIIEEIKVTKQMVPKTNGDNTNDFDRNASDVTQVRWSSTLFAHSVIRSLTSSNIYTLYKI